MTSGSAFAGCLDYLDQSHALGWAVMDGSPAVPEAYINERLVPTRHAVMDRPDLDQHGLPRAAGFVIRFMAPLGLDDTVDLRFENGSSLTNAPSSVHRDRLSPLLHGISATCRGLEIGPLHQPLLSKAKYAVEYVDHLSREDLIVKYQPDPAMAGSLEIIVDVDHVWTGGTGLAAIIGNPVDYVLAAHVIEHVPDPIGWMRELALCLKPGGRLNLAIPEKTRTFDHLRMPSTPAAMVEAHRLQLTRPSYMQIFDHILGISALEGSEPDWRKSALNAYDCSNGAEASGEYADIHCHVWTHETFRHCWTVIEPLLFVPLVLDRINPPFAHWAEFTASFIRI